MADHLLVRLGVRQGKQWGVVAFISRKTKWHFGRHVSKTQQIR